MSTRRKAKFRFTGKGICRWCGEPVPKGRRSWCSQACVDDYTIRAWPGKTRSVVLRRDGGVCSECGLDCRELRLRLLSLSRRARDAYRDRVRAMAWKLPPEPPSPHTTADRDGRVAAGKWLLREIGWLLREYGFRETLVPAQLSDEYLLGRRDTLWDADHVVPVVEGGGECGLDNYRTLCIPCHKRATKALAGRRATAARDKERMEAANGS